MIMDTTPSADKVYQGVYTLYNNPNNTEKEQAAKWLEDFQKSVYSWSIADELLQQKRDLISCYFAAQTMRSKIQNSFHELPQSSHESLRDALMMHISQITLNTDKKIVTQLCLAVADLSLLMSTWKNSTLNLIEKLSNDVNTIWPLLIILTLIPEEINSRYLRLGANRRDDIMKELETNSRIVLEFLSVCLTSTVTPTNCDIQIDIVKCFTSWLSVHVINLDEIIECSILKHCFTILRDPTTNIGQNDASVDGLCTLLQCIETNNNHQQLLENQVFQGILALEDAYHLAVAHEDVDKATNYCRLFTGLAETFLSKMIIESTDAQPHYSIKVLDLVLNCVGHYDYEVAEITFNLWFKLSEDVYNKVDINVGNHFKPYIERLISAIYRHSQIDSDHEGLIDESESFYEFRKKVSDLIKDVVFIAGSSNVFKTMFYSLQDPSVTWERSEAALFVMETVARNILTDESIYVPKVIEAILNLPENTHIAVRYTSILLMGELCEWIDHNSDYLESILNFLLIGLQQKTGLASAAASSLQQICSVCTNHMTKHIDGLVQIVKSLDSFEISNDFAIGLLKGISTIIGRISNDQIPIVLREICTFQISPLLELLEKDIELERSQRSDPSFWLDRLAAILQHTQPNIKENEIHPSAIVLTDIWPVISNVMEKYQNDFRVMERACRLLRYAVRGIGQQSGHILEPLVKQIVNLYSRHQHSCFLYLGSVLVDEFGKNPACAQGLLEMLQAFIEPSFNILQEEDGLKNHPDTVDDFFRLCTRFIQRCPLEFLQSQILNPILQCAILACTLSHKDANQSVMKFLVSLLTYGIPDNASKYPVEKELVRQIVEVNGEALVMNLVHASVFCLHSYMLNDVADVINHLKQINLNHLGNYLKMALDALPKKNSGGHVTATEQQLIEFQGNILKAEASKAICYALKDLAHLYR